MADEYVKLFNEKIVPACENHGIKVENAWLTQDKTRFFWVRSFADADDMKAKEAALQASQEWKSIEPNIVQIARGDILLAESVLDVAARR
jgi:hypothetical protein